MQTNILSNIFSDHMIIQRDKPITFWGVAKKDTKIELTFNDENFTTVSNAKGEWEINTPALSADGKIRTINVKCDDDSQVIKDVLMGDIWLCSGQSNMEINMLRTRRMFGEINKTVVNPNIRKYHVPMNYHFDEPQKEIPAASWISVKPGNTEIFTATGYFFADEIQKFTKVPVGIILSALGGTPIESWMSKDALFEYPEKIEEAHRHINENFRNELIKNGQKNTDQWYEAVNKFDRGLAEGWSFESCDVSNWKPINLNDRWDEIVDLKGPGVVWLRKEIDIPETKKDLLADIILGTVVDADEVYINGELVGSTGYQYPPRDYAIKNLKAGVNTIAIRVISANGTGGFTFGKTHKILFENGEEMPLTTGWVYKRSLSCEAILSGSPAFQNVPTGNYNGMIAPLSKMKMTGVLWYQGESNAGNPQGYANKLKRLIADWRKNLNDEKLPFFVAQLPNWSPKGDKINWALLRNEQQKVLEVENTRMVVTYDTGEYNDLHPLNKKAVGVRLAKEALTLIYKAPLVSTSPTIQTIDTSKNQLTLSFETYGSSLEILNSEIASGFDLWINKVQIPVEGILVDNEIVITSNYLDDATHISFAFSDDPSDANLYNKEKLPAAPFKKELRP